MKLKKYQRLLLAVFSGLLLSLGWAQWSSGLFLMVGFVPLLIIEDYYYDQQKGHKTINVFLYSYLTFFTWNAITTWWIYNSTLFGVSIALIFNSLFMSVVFTIFHVTKRISGKNVGYFSLLIYWIAFEFLHLNWDLSWPWLTLGNGFGNNVSIIQWYEYTGALGGSFWVIILNILIYCSLITIVKPLTFRSLLRTFFIPLLVIIIPVILSLGIYFSYNEIKKPVNFIILQPNIDPYNEKFGGMPVEKQLNIMLELAEKHVDKFSNYIIGPETALADPVYENDIELNEGIRTIRKFIRRFPNVNFVVGASSYRIFNNVAKVPQAGRKLDKDNSYYVDYNTALQIDTSKRIQVYHKSKLVLGVEKMPFPGTLTFLEKLSLKLGGTSGSLGSQEERTTFQAVNMPVKIAPVICYESIYGEFISQYVKNGANFLVIITNDGWWGNTPGYRQHLSYARLRAVESRRSIARSANTGISCFIDQRGDIIKRTSWWKPESIYATLNSNTEKTFYSRSGDYPGVISSFLTALILLFSLVRFIITFFNNKK